jgi:hypothetical protein
MEYIASIFRVENKPSKNPALSPLSGFIALILDIQNRGEMFF